jgi:hypothetical protein
VQKQGRQVLPHLPDLHTLILPAAFLMLTVAASASAFKRPNLLNAAHGFLPGRSSFLFKMSSAVSTTDAGLYVVLGDHLSTPTKGPQETSYKPRPPACGAARDAPADNYGRKLKPTAKKTRKTRQKTKKTLKGRVAGAGHARYNTWYDRGLHAHRR